jgi:hypothetical protein
MNRKELIRTMRELDAMIGRAEPHTSSFYQLIERRNILHTYLTTRKWTS